MTIPIAVPTVHTLEHFSNRGRCCCEKWPCFRGGGHWGHCDGRGRGGGIAEASLKNPRGRDLTLTVALCLQMSIERVGVSAVPPLRVVLQEAVEHARQQEEEGGDHANRRCCCGEMHVY